MKLVFIMNQYGVCRMYYRALLELAKRGHDLQLYFTSIKIPKGGGKAEGEEVVDALERESSRLVIHRTPIPARSDKWANLSLRVRLLRDLLRYYHPDYRNAHKLRERLERVVDHPTWVKNVRRLNRVLGTAGIKLFDGILRLMDRFIPADPFLGKFLRDQRPDMVLFSRLLDPGCSQMEYLKAAKAEGIPTVACIASWDNLTNKGILQVAPDRVFVWNEFQVNECDRYHGIPAKHVIATGAQVFDDWFDGEPEFSLEDVCLKSGLAKVEFYLLYVCSSSFIAAKIEKDFVEEWLKALRSTLLQSLRSMNIIIRPHPQNAAQWAKVALDDGNTSVYPRGGEYVGSAEAKAFYSSLLYHARGVVGINTSAMVEAGIFDKPVFTILRPEFALTQEGTLHFSYLIDRGLALKAKSLDEHVQQLATTFGGEPSEQAARRREFVKRFLRPRGLDVRASSVFADEMERVGSELA